MSITEVFTVRKATPNDVPLILHLIRELAEYEKLLHEVVADEETLHQNLFGEVQGPEVLIAEENSRAVGFVLFFHNFSTFLGKKGVYIEDLYIRSEYRGKGYGEKLLREICKIAAERNCGRVDWWVLNWNERAIRFYKKMGAKSMDGWTVFRLDEEALRHLTQN